MIKPCPNCAKRTLWKARLDIGGRKQDMLFRSTDDFAQASNDAVKLLESSPSAEMTGAVISQIERIARLWN